MCSPDTETMVKRFRSLRLVWEIEDVESPKSRDDTMILLSKSRYFRRYSLRMVFFMGESKSIFLLVRFIFLKTPFVFRKSLKSNPDS